MTLKMAAPSEIKTIICTVENAIAMLKDPRADKMRLMVITPTVADAVTIAKALPTQIEMVNVGNAGKMNQTTGKKIMLTKEALLTESEVKALKNLVEIYPETFSRYASYGKEKC